MPQNKLVDIEYLNNKIKELKAINKSADVQLLEKTIGALHLVELLSKSKLQFVFKGGTSLTILLEDIKRFSVDVDIITEEDFEKVDEILNKIALESNIITRVEENYRNNAVTNRMKIKHYKLYYTSVTDGSEKFILLDVAIEKSVYPRMVEKEISCNRLDLKSNEKVVLPSIESVLGDKLTVLSPKYTGISFDSEKHLELVKQIYDVNNLFDESENIEVIKESFANICDRELKYRKMEDVTKEEVLFDIESLCYKIIIQEDEKALSFLSIGIGKFTNYMLKKSFKRDEEALTAACKILYLVKCIRNSSDIVKYNQDIGIEDSINYDLLDVKLRRRIKNIKKLDNESFYYINEVIK